MNDETLAALERAAVRAWNSVGSMGRKDSKLIRQHIATMRVSICRHNDPRCKDDPCPRAIYEAQCKPD